MQRKTMVIAICAMCLVQVCCIGIVGLVVFQVQSNPAISSGFQQLGDDLRDMNDLQQKLLGVYPADQVEVKMVNGHILNVNLINSSINQLPQPERAGKAREIAVFAKKNYGGTRRVDKIQIAFVEHQQVAIVSMNQSANFIFDVATLPEY